MKKILYCVLISCLMSIAMADIDFSSAIKSTSMPTDDEIRATISQFNFTAEQQEAIFKDTKRKLQEMYSGKNPAQTNAQLNQYFNQIENGSLDSVLDPSVKQELIQTVSTLPKTTSESTGSVSSATTSNSKTTNKTKNYGPEKNWFKSGLSK